MKRQLCFKITTKLGNSKRQHYSRQEKNIYIYIYIYMRKGPLFKKAREGKERREVERTGRSFIHI